MDKNLTELVFILDRSGSMGGLESDTIGGFNSLLEKQKKVEGKCNLTTVLFDHDYELLHDRINIQAVSPLTEKDYYVRGSTALLDAVGRTISKIEHVQETTAEEYRAGKVMFVIITDGMENASREYTTKKVKSMIEAEKEKGWEFVFLGANMDAVETARRQIRYQAELHRHERCRRPVPNLRMRSERIPQKNPRRRCQTRRKETQSKEVRRRSIAKVFKHHKCTCVSVFFSNIPARKGL